MRSVGLSTYVIALRSSRNRQGFPGDELLRRLHEVATEVDHVLEAFDPARLMDTTDRSGTSSTYVQTILHQVIHFAAHAGQIIYATKLLKAGAIDELWRKTLKDTERSP